MIFGCHLSIKEGYFGAAKNAHKIRAAAFQYFPKNPRRLSVKDFDRIDAQLCKSFCEENEIMSIGHSPYPAYLTPVSKEKRELLKASIFNDLEIAEACGSIGVVVHFGKPIPQISLLETYERMIELLNEIFKEWEGSAKLLIENNAGFPGAFGTTLEELVQIRKLCEYPENIGFCFDTCHAYSCGLWDGENWGELFTQGLELGYFSALEVIHLNNSKYATGQGKDRHASIFGTGYIKDFQFDRLLTTSHLEDIPFILETPKEEITHAEEIIQLQNRWGT